MWHVFGGYQATSFAALWEARVGVFIYEIGRHQIQVLILGLLSLSIFSSVNKAFLSLLFFPLFVFCLEKNNSCSLTRSPRKFVPLITQLVKDGTYKKGTLVRSPLRSKPCILMDLDVEVGILGCAVLVNADM